MTRRLSQQNKVLISGNKLNKAGKFCPWRLSVLRFSLLVRPRGVPFICRKRFQSWINRYSMNRFNLNFFFANDHPLHPLLNLVVQVDLVLNVQPVVLEKAPEKIPLNLDFKNKFHRWSGNSFFLFKFFLLKFHIFYILFFTRVFLSRH